MTFLDIWDYGMQDNALDDVQKGPEDWAQRGGGLLCKSRQAGSIWLLPSAYLLTLDASRSACGLVCPLFDRRRVFGADIPTHLERTKMTHTPYSLTKP